MNTITFPIKIYELYMAHACGGKHTWKYSSKEKMLNKAEEYQKKFFDGNWFCFEYQNIDDLINERNCKTVEKGKIDSIVNW